MIKFPKNFKFGGSTSGPQTEGSFDKYNQHIFDYWSEREPNAFFNQIGSNITSNVYYNYKNDIELLKKIGIKIYRTSIQWTRLIKNFATNEVDQQAVAFYRDYFQKLKDADIEVIVNLFHFDMPMYWQDKGGWLNKEVTDAFAGYAKLCFELFGDVIDLWATMNEPIVVVEACYINDFWYPKANDFKKGIQVAYNEILANAKAIREFRLVFKNKPMKAVTTMVNLTPTIASNQKPENLKAAAIADLFHNQAFLDPLVKGTFPKQLKKYLIELDVLPDYTDSELQIIKNNTIDFLGVNYYAPRRVQAPLAENKNSLSLARFYREYHWPQAQMNESRGWEIYPKAIKLIAETIKNRYDNIKWWVSENGMGIQNEEQFKNDQGKIQDDYRIKFIRYHLIELGQAINEGANCFAYCIWAPIDCWSWANAYKNRYGLINVNLETQERNIKKSGEYFKNISDLKQVI